MLVVGRKLICVISYKNNELLFVNDIIRLKLYTIKSKLNDMFYLSNLLSVKLTHIYHHGFHVLV